MKRLDPDMPLALYLHCRLAIHLSNADRLRNRACSQREKKGRDNVKHAPIWFLLALASISLLRPAPDPRSSNSPNWPRWRGPNADGVAEGSDLPTHWSQTGNVRWSVKLPGWGTSSPVVYRNRLFVTSQAEQGGRKSLLTLSFDRETGREVWRHDFGLGVDQRTHEKSNLAVNTPAVTDDSVYVAFGNSDIARYSHGGELIWVTRYMTLFGDPRMAWGYAASPVVLEDSVLLPWDHHKGPCYLVGLDKRTGQIAWKLDRPIGTAHATPLLVKHHGQADILVSGKSRLTAFDAGTHAELWTYGEGEGPFNGEIVVSPVYGDGTVFLQLWRQSPIHAIRLVGGGMPPELVWISERPGPQEPTPLYYQGLLYVLMDNGVLVCLDGKTGKEVYRTRLGGACNSSPVAANGRIYFSNNDGTTFVVKAGREFQLLATNNLGERITASPAIAGNEIFYRTDSRLYCIGKNTEP
jgi:outer membrane protein assembly factor BamB